MSKRIEGILAGIGRFLDEPEIPKENVNRRFSNSTGKNVEPFYAPNYINDIRTEQPVFPLSQLEGHGVLFPESDVTAHGATLVGLGNKPLARPVELNTGVDHIFYDPDALWKSDMGVVNKFMQRAERLQRQTGGKDVYLLPYSGFGGSSDFFSGIGRTMMNYNLANAPASTVKQMDNIIRDRVPTWKGSAHRGAETAWNEIPVGTRMFLTEKIDKELRNQGSLSEGQARVATARQEQLGVDQHGQLRNVGVLDVNAGFKPNKSPDYNASIFGEGAGVLGIPELTAYDLLLDRVTGSGKPLTSRSLQWQDTSKVITEKDLQAAEKALEARGVKLKSGLLPTAATLGTAATSLLGSEEADAGIIPKLAQTTQRANTVPTAKAANAYLEKQGATGKSIDYGAGFGINAKAIDYDDTFEPFAEEGFTPTYTNSADIPENTYGKLVSTNVLNVIPPDLRNDAVLSIGKILKPNGMAVVQTRSASAVNELSKSKTAVPQDEPASFLTSKGSYQKGFTRDELVDYTQGILGDGFEVSKVPAKDMPNGSGVLIKKLPTLAAMGVGASLLFPSEDIEAAILPPSLRFGIPSEMKSIALNAMEEVPRKSKTSYTGWKKALNKAGVKDVELKQMGFYQEFGHRQKAQDISRQEVEDFLKQKQYNIREIVRTNRDVTAPIEADPFGRGYEVYSPEGGVFHGRYDTIEEAEDAADQLSYRQDDTMHRESQLAPDLSTNYREIELMDGPDADKLDAVNKSLQEAKQEVADLMGVGPLEIHNTDLVRGPERTAILEKREKLMNRVHEIEADRKNLPAPFLATAHWNEDANVLAHIRAADRQMDDGSTTLMVEEIQSDLHQRGQTIGYAKEGEAKNLFKKRDEIVDKINAVEKFDIYTWGPKNEPKLMQDLQDATDGISNKNALDLLEELEQKRNADYLNLTGKNWFEHKYALEQEELRLWRAATQKETSAPDFPFKSDDKSSWYDLAFRRAMLEAAEGNYDSISFTTANQQVERWQDDDGLRNFYDKTLPNHINKWAKKYGVQLQTKELDVTQDDYRVDVYDDDTFFIEDEFGNHVQDFDTMQEAEAFMADHKWREDILTLPITKEMREDINKKGMRLFSNPLIGAGVYGTVAAGATGLLPDDDKQQTTNVVYDDRDTRREQSRQNLMDMLADDARQERGDSIKNIAANVAALPNAMGEGIQQGLMDAMSFIPESFARGGAALSGGDTDAAAASVRSFLRPEVEASSARTRMLRDAMGENIAYNTGNVIDALTPAALAIYQSKGLFGPSLEETVSGIRSAYQNLPEGYFKDNVLPATGYGALGVLGMLDFYRPKPRALTGEWLGPEQASRVPASNRVYKEPFTVDAEYAEYDVLNPLGLLQMAN